jgi:hypothetical protein
MSAIKDARYPIELDKERHLYFSLNAIDELTDKYGGFDKFTDAIQGDNRIKDLIWIMTLLLNEGAAYTQYMTTGQETGAEVLTERIVSLILNSTNLTLIQSSIYKAFTLSNSGTTEPPETGGDDDEADEDDDEETDGENKKGNVKAGGKK